MTIARAAGQLATAGCGGARRRTAARCRGGRCPRGASARRRPPRRAGRRCPAPARRHGCAARRTPGCGLEHHRLDPGQVQQLRERSSPAGPAPTIATCVRGTTALSTLEQRRLALPDADAQGREAVATAAAAQLVQQRDHEPRAAHPERVPERDRAAVDVDALGVDAELADDGDASATRRPRSARPGRSRRSRRRCARAAAAPPAPGRCPSPRGSTPAAARADERPERLGAELARALLARDDERRRAVVDARWSCPP